MGRKMKVISSTKKHLTKDEIAARKTIEDKASDGLAMLQKTAPRHFNPIARAEYERIIKDLRNLPVRNLDRSLVELYCTWYAIYKETSRKLDETGYFIFSDEKGLVPNPLILTLEKATTNIRMTANSLGLTVDSRLRIFSPKVEEKKESVFDRFGG